MIRGVVFDLWNTLVYSPAGSPFQRIKGLMRPGQLPYHPDLQRVGMTRPFPSVEAFLDTWRDLADLDPDQLVAMAEAFQEAGDQAQFFPGAPESIAAVRDLARVALLSNTQTFGLDLLNRLGFPERFRTQVLSAEIGVLKPDLGAFEAIQRRMGLFPGNLVMVGDTWVDDVEGAVAAGWTAVWVNREKRPRPPADPDAPIYELRDLALLPDLIRDLQEGQRCPTCLG